jgi:hypothetical protein
MFRERLEEMGLTISINIMRTLLNVTKMLLFRLEEIGISAMAMTTMVHANIFERSNFLLAGNPP